MPPALISREPTTIVTARELGRLLFEAVFSIETLNASGSINQALLPGIERMTIRADFDLNCGECRAGLESIAACARHHASAIIRMDFSFHRLSAGLLTGKRKYNHAGRIAQLLAIIRDSAKRIFATGYKPNKMRASARRLRRGLAGSTARWIGAGRLGRANSV